MQCRIKVVTKNGKSYNGPITEYTLGFSAKQEVAFRNALSNVNDVVELTTDDENWWLIPVREISVVHLAVWDDTVQLPLGDANG